MLGRSAERDCPPDQGLGNWSPFYGRNASRVTPTGVFSTEEEDGDVGCDFDEINMAESPTTPKKSFSFDIIEHNHVNMDPHVYMLMVRVVSALMDDDNKGFSTPQISGGNRNGIDATWETEGVRCLFRSNFVILKYIRAPVECETFEIDALECLRSSQPVVNDDDARNVGVPKLVGIICSWLSDPRPSVYVPSRNDKIREELCTLSTCLSYSLSNRILNLTYWTWRRWKLLNKKYKSPESAVCEADMRIYDAARDEIRQGEERIAKAREMVSKYQARLEKLVDLLEPSNCDVPYNLEESPLHSKQLNPYSPPLDTSTWIQNDELVRARLYEINKCMRECEEGIDMHLGMQPGSCFVHSTHLDDDECELVSNYEKIEQHIDVLKSHREQERELLATEGKMRPWPENWIFVY